MSLPKATPGGLLFPHSSPHPHSSFSADSRRETLQSKEPPREEDSEAGPNGGLCLLSLSLSGAQQLSPHLFFWHMTRPQPKQKAWLLPL